MAGADVPPTERRNPRSSGLDRLDARAIAALMNSEDAGVPAAVAAALDDVARAVDLAAEALGRGGRLVYLGAGTSGRIASLDAAEVPPTFGLEPGRVVAVLAGGPEALTQAVEGAEDDALSAVADVRALDVGPSDCVVGVTASGTTRFVLGGLGECRERGASTVLVTCGGRPARSPWHVVIAVDTGPEVLAGSTRLKAGTATKLVLNMISTAAMVRLGRVYENLMVDLRATNAKLRRRAARILEEAAGLPAARAAELLAACGGELKTALVAARRSLPAADARAALARRGGSVRAALEEPP